MQLYLPTPGTDPYHHPTLVGHSQQYLWTNCSCEPELSARGCPWEAFKFSALNLKDLLRRYFLPIVSLDILSLLKSGSNMCISPLYASPIYFIVPYAWFGH